MTVEPPSKHRAEHDGQTYDFCSARCRERFVADPEQFLGEPAPHVQAPEGTVFTCPMHPEIEQIGPGDCPKCGMALESRTVSVDDDADNP